MTGETATSDTLTAVPSNVVSFSRAVRERLSSQTAELFESIPSALRAEPSSSTAAPQVREPLDEAAFELRRILNLTDDDVFEDGVENEISRTIPLLIARFGSTIVEAVARLYLGHMMTSDVACEILRWIGAANHETSRDSRFWFLVYCLRDGDPRMRSAAALGLASLEDARAVPYLRREAQVERVGLLRARLEKVADELEG